MGRRRALRVSIAPVRDALRRRETGTRQPGAAIEQGHGEYWMNFPRCFRLALLALVPAAAISLSVGAALAQSPPPPAAATPAPATSPSPAATATPVPPPAETKSPADMPSTAQTPPPPAASPVQTADPFGEQITLEPKTVVIVKGNANWDSAFDTLIDSFKTLQALLDKQGIKSSGNAMIVYTSTDDTGFTYLAEIPVDQDPKNLTKAMSMGKSPDGKALKFVHRGSYDNMDNTYEAITNHLDDKKLEAKDTFIEEYITDPLKTAEDKLVINVYVPLK
jgi:effector-binding domain-containing protein